ncbi:MAG: protein translocase subunit SecD [Candidatus Colwellbacteria bacterium]|nr:protein translocase subunit SecD [Candidatus Colwellbacteria bacterium]
MRSNRFNVIVFIIIIIVTAVSAVFVFPKNLGVKYMPWRLGLDLVGGTSLIYDIDLSQVNQKDYDSVVSGLKDVIEKRVNSYGVSEPKITTAKRGGSYELIVDLAGIKDLKDAVRQIGETPNLDFREMKVEGENAVFTPTNLTGRYITGASLGFNNLNKPIVYLKFNSEGAKIFEELTGRNVGQNLAIFLDNQFMDAPRVNEKISGGNAQISGGGTGFSIDEATKLVQRLNAGALSAPIKLVNQRTVDANAAADSLQKIIFAGVVGTILVILFMLIYYKFLGLFAATALIIYTVLSMALFKSGVFGLVPGFTMTLAGIAGFILSIGMAVDANILIFERTKEELKRGLAKSSAIEEGFKRAWLSIRDSNTSTIITAGVLYFFTSSFVKGFALTLGLGVMVSMLSAIFVTKTMLKLFIRK